MTDALAMLAIAALVCASVLAGLVLVLRHLGAMRVTAGEVAELRKQWKDGSTAIAGSQKLLDEKLVALSDDFTRIKNRLGNAR